MDLGFFCRGSFGFGGRGEGDIVLDGVFRTVREWDLDLNGWILVICTIYLELGEGVRRGGARGRKESSRPRSSSAR